MPQRLPKTRGKLGAVIHGHDGVTVWGAVTLLANSVCEVNCDHVFRFTEEVDIHVRGMGLIRARVISVESGVTTAQLIEDCPV